MAVYPHSTALTDALNERKPDRRTELADLYDEIAALRAEKRGFAHYLESIAHELWTTYLGEHWPHPEWERVKRVAQDIDHKADRLTLQGGN